MSDALDGILRSPDGVDIRLNEPLAPYTGYKTGGKAKVVLAPRDEGSFIKCVRSLLAAGEKFFVLGNGTNTLAPDEGYDGCALLTEGALDDIAFEGCEVACGAGVPLVTLCRECRERGLSGVEFAYGIPGTVGGAIYMNAGAYGGEMKQVVETVKILTNSGDIVELAGDDMEFAYRSSRVQREGGIILAARLKLTRAPETEISAKMEELMARRRDKQPLDYPSCGSTFKRPEGQFAGKLIDDCGLRGFRIGGAQISEKHCGFVINAGGATSTDILRLIDCVQQTVLKETGFFLECEIKIMR